jgi:hypothetical protein
MVVVLCGMPLPRWNKFVVSSNQIHILDFSVYLYSTRILVVGNTKSNAPSIFISPG